MDTPRRPPAARRCRAARGRSYVPAIGPKLRVLLFVVFGLFAFLGATGVYLGGGHALNYAQSPQSYTTPFSLWVFLAHVAVGVLGTLPFLAFGVYHWCDGPNAAQPRRGAARHPPVPRRAARLR